MKVAFDASTAAFRQKTGTGVYCEELIKAYQERFTDDEVIHTYRLSRRMRGRDFLLPITSNAKREILLDPWTYYKGHHYDIFHGLNSRLPLLAHSKMVATIHDLFSIYGEFSDAQFREDQARKLKQMIDRASHIIVPATFTKEQLVERVGIEDAKVTVVGEGVREIYLENVPREESKERVRDYYKIANPYLLFVGTLEKRKNVVGLVKAFACLQKLTLYIPDLVLVGHKGYLYDEIKAEIESSGMKAKIKILGFVGEKGLADLYRGCEAFVYLSLEEGFGIPVIEAMACGVPLVSSNTTSLPEVGGGHTWLVNPLDAEAAAQTIYRVLQKDDYVLNRVRQAQAYARRQTWTKVAEDTRAVYSKLNPE